MAKACGEGADCASLVCLGTCQAPSPNDGVKNGTETDVDCGGAGEGVARCADGKACAAGTDCASAGCNDLKVCAAGRSCTKEYGGRTCGLGGAGGVGAAQWEDCCATAPVTAGGVTVQLDKYEVTAGRYRVFLEDVGYNIRSFVQAARAAGVSVKAVQDLNPELKRWCTPPASARSISTVSHFTGGHTTSSGEPRLSV